MKIIPLRSSLLSELPHSSFTTSIYSKIISPACQTFTHFREKIILPHWHLPQGTTSQYSLNEITHFKRSWDICMCMQQVLFDYSIYSDKSKNKYNLKLTYSVCVVTAPQPCFVFAFFCSLFFCFSISPCVFIIHIILPVIFGYVTFHSFVFIFSSLVSIVWFTFFCH